MNGLELPLKSLPSEMGTILQSNFSSLEAMQSSTKPDTCQNLSLLKLVPTKSMNRDSVYLIGMLLLSQVIFMKFLTAL